MPQVGYILVGGEHAALGEKSSEVDLVRKVVRRSRIGEQNEAGVKCDAGVFARRRRARCTWREKQ